MNYRLQPAGLIRHAFPFAMLAFSCASGTCATGPDLAVTPATLNFSYQAGAAALPAAQTLQLSSTGAAFAFTVAVSGPAPYLAHWLTVSAAQGNTPTALKVFVNPTGLPSGSYPATIAITAPSAATPVHNVTVMLVVGDAPPTLTVSKTSLTFSYTTGGAAPAGQPLVLTSSGGVVSTSITLSGGTWLKASPGASIQLVGTPGTVMVSADPTGMAPGSYTGKITFAAPATVNKSVVVNVTLTVVAGVPTITNLWPPGASIGSAATIVTVSGTNFFPTSTASIGAVQLTATVLSSAAMLVTIPASSLAAAGTIPITVATPSASSPSAPAPFAVYPPGPLVWAVADAASYAPNVSPGELITIYGVGLGPSPLVTLAGTDPISTNLSTTSVTINGVAAPILYTSANQVGCIVPFSLASKIGSTVNVLVTYNQLIAAAPFQVSVTAANPGLFTMDSSGVGQGAILNYNSTTGDYSVNGQTTPAAKGSIAVLYLTGFGATVCADMAPSLCNPTATEANLISGHVQPSATLGVTIDGQVATIAGVAAPIGGVAGIMQINVTVPTTAKSGNAVPVVVTVGTGNAQVSSQSTVTMAVK